jgi:hypothetical protein
MKPITHVTVTAPEGRKTPIPPEDGIEPGGGLMHVQPGFVRRVRYSHATLRAIDRRDLFLCDLDGTPVDSVALAAAPVELETPKVLAKCIIELVDGVRRLRPSVAPEPPEKKDPAPAELITTPGEPRPAHTIVRPANR